MKAAIVGAGIVGCQLAYGLLHDGWQVDCYDDHPLEGSQNCSDVAAGLLTPVSELTHADPIIYHMGCDSLQNHYPRLLSKLNSEIYFRNQGSIIVSHPKDNAMLQDRLEKICLGRVKRLTAEDIKQLEPSLSKFEQGYYLLPEGQIDSQGLMYALRNALQKSATWYAECKVIKTRAKEIAFTGKVQKYDLVCDCRGLGARDNHFPHLRGVRGELVLLHAPKINLHHPIRLIHPQYHFYLVPRLDNHYLVGASEWESESMSPISVRTTLELLSGSCYINSGFFEARILRTMTHCRPTLPQNLPHVFYANGFIAINGLYRHGFLISPTIVDDVLRFLRGGISAVKFSTIWEQVDD